MIIFLCKISMYNLVLTKNQDKEIMFILVRNSMRSFVSQVIKFRNNIQEKVMKKLTTQSVLKYFCRVCVSAAGFAGCFYSRRISVSLQRAHPERAPEGLNCPAMSCCLIRVLNPLYGYCYLQ